MSTYTQIYIQVVFAVKGRQSMIASKFEDRIYKYITGIIQARGQKMLAINGVPDHIHFLIGMRPTCNLSELIREVKKSSNQFIKENSLSQFSFNWQEGFGAFSYSHSDIDRVIKYIANQKQHHSKATFRDEYVDMLNSSQVTYDEKYLFQWIDQPATKEGGQV
jgi:putative transposase